MEYLHIAGKIAAAFLVVVVYIRLSGKGSLAPISALDQVGNIVLGAIIGGPLYNPAISVFMLVGVAGLWAALLLGARYVSYQRRQVKNIVDGRSIRLMENGNLLSGNFSQARLSPRDFIMLLHQRGYTDLNELSDVWFEYNGQMTVVKKGGPAMATVLVENGDVDDENMKLLGLDDAWLLGQLAERGYKPEDVFLAEWHDQKLWVYPMKS